MNVQISRAGNDRETIRFGSDLADVGQCRDELTDFLHAHDADEEVLEDLRLVVSELVSNAIQHGSQPGGSVTVQAEPDRFILDVSCADSVPDPATRTTPATTDRTGRGLIVVEAMADGVTFVDVDDERLIRCIRSR